MADNEDSAQNTATTQQPLPREYISGYEDTTLSVMQHDLNILIPWCSVGICSLFLDLSWPGCFGFGYACDCCCCSSEWGVCRILCEEGDCCQRSGNCDAFPPPSNVNLKRTPNDWCSVMQEEFSCGDFKTFCAFKTEQCCCQQRLAIPTNSIKSTPWMVNCLGFTLCYQWSYPMACCVDVKGLKEMTQEDEHPEWANNCCPNYCLVEAREEEATQPQTERSSSEDHPVTVSSKQS